MKENSKNMERFKENPQEKIRSPQIISPEEKILTLGSEETRKTEKVAKKKNGRIASTHNNSQSFDSSCLRSSSFFLSNPNSKTGSQAEPLKNVEEFIYESNQYLPMHAGDSLPVLEIPQKQQKVFQDDTDLRDFEQVDYHGYFDTPQDMSISKQVHQNNIRSKDLITSQKSLQINQKSKPSLIFPKLTEEEEETINNQHFRDQEIDGNTNLDSIFQIQDSQVYLFSGQQQFQEQKQIKSEKHKHGSSISTSQSTRLHNEQLSNGHRRGSNQGGKGIISFGIDFEDTESPEFEEKFPLYTQKSIQSTKRNKLECDLKTINEQHSFLHADEKSPQHSSLNESSVLEQRKIVSDYLFSDREPLHQNEYSKCFVACKNQQLVLIKLLERKKVSLQQQEFLKKEQRNLKDMTEEIVYQLQEDKEEQISENQNSINNAGGKGKRKRTVVNLIDFFFSRNYIYFVSEYLHQQNLYFLISNAPKNKINEAKALVILKKISEAVDEVLLTAFSFNSKNINCNLKLENIFWDGNTIKLSDFSYSYQQAKRDILNSKEKDNAFSQNNSLIYSTDVIQMGIIFLQLICGIDASQQTKSFAILQKYLHSQGVLRQTSEFILKCIFDESTTVGDIRNNVQKLLQKSKNAKEGFTSPTINAQRANQISNQNEEKMFQQINLNSQTNQVAQFTPFILLKSNSLIPKHFQLLEKEEKKLHQKRKSLTEIRVGNHFDFLQINQETQKLGKEEIKQKQKTTQLTFLKNYSYKQSSKFYELTITHLKMMKYQIEEEILTNNHEIQTIHKIPVFGYQEKFNYSIKKKAPLSSINFNPKYSWVFLNELDNQEYFDLTPPSHLHYHFDQKKKYLIEGYKKIQRQRFHFMRCKDMNSKKCYTLKCITIEDDQEFHDVLREIAIHKYIDHNLHKGISISHFNGNEENVNKSGGIKEENTQQSAQQLALLYLQQLYQKADKEVDKQLEGGIHKTVDSYIVNRMGKEITFVLVFEDISFSLKDYILKNQVNSDKSLDVNDILQEQMLLMIKVIAKQIKKLKQIGIYHNNITPENILFSDYKSGSHKILLSNFQGALIKKYDESDNQFSSTFLKMPSQFNKYKAPEIRKTIESSLQEKELIEFDPIKSDVYSLGLCCLELQIQKIIQNSEISKQIQLLDQDNIVEGLITSMLHQSNSFRVSEGEILNYIKAERFFDEQDKKGNYQGLIAEGKSSNIKLQNQSIFEVQIQRTRHKAFTLSFPQFDQLESQVKKRNQTLDKKNKEVAKLANNKNIFIYKEINLNNIDEVAGDMQLLYQSKCARKIFLFPHSLQILDSLKQKYLKAKQKSTEQINFELYLFEEWGNFRKDYLDLKGALVFYEKAFSIQQRYGQEEYHTAAKLQFKIASIQLILDPKYCNQAISLLKTALESFKEVFHNSTPKFIPILIQIGDEFALKEQFVDALHIYQECMIITNLIGFQGPLGIKLLDKLGWAFFQQSDYQSAQRFFLKSVSLKEKVYAERELSLAETYNNLAECLRILSEHSKALFYYEQALSIIATQLLEQEQIVSSKFQKHKLPEKEIEGIKQMKAQVYNNLGLMYKRMGKFEKAMKLFTESLNIRKELFGQSSIESNECLYNFALISSEQNKHTEAMGFYDQVIQQFKLIKDIENPIYAECLQNKGISCYYINDFTKALSLLNESLTIKKKKNPQSLSVAISIQNIALIYHKQGQYKKSLQLYEDALRLFLKKLKPDHPFISTIQENMKHTQRFAN